jgi:hypothetical protein
VIGFECGDKLTVSGIDFDRGRNFVRFSDAGPRAAIHEAARRT